MKNKILIPIIGLVGLFSFLCSWNDFKDTRVPTLERLSETKRVTIRTKVYTPEDSKQFLNRDLISRGYQPVQVTLHNNTSSVVTVEGFDIPQPTAGEMARAITSEALPRRIGFTVASFFFWPFTIPSSIDSIKTFNSHSRMKRDFAARSIKLETLPPYSTLNRILFIRNEEVKDKEILTLTLYDQFSGKLEEHQVKLT